MNRWLHSWLGRPAKQIRRGLLVERLEDRTTPAADKLLAQPIRLDSLATTQDVLATTSSAYPLNDLTNAVNYLGLSSVVDVAGSRLVMPGLLQIHLKTGVTARDAAVTLFSTGLYRSVTPNYIFATGDLREMAPNDPQYSQQFPHGIIGSEVAWNRTVGSSAVVVAVLDDGIDISHPDLLANIWTNAAEISGDGIDNDGNGYIDDKFGWDFVANSSDVTPDNVAVDIHGTQIAGILAGRINNGTGIAGVAGGSRVMPIQVIGNGSMTSLTLIRAVNYAVDNGAKIINCSINIDPFLADASFQSAIKRAYDAGVLWVNSAGNLNLQDPARSTQTNMLVVGATDRADRKTSYSNYGWGLDLAAPGGSSSDGVLTTVPGGYGTAWGTSVSAPLVAGAAALIWSANPSWTREQVVNALLVNVDPADPNFLDKLGTGRLNAGTSVTGSGFVTPLGKVYDIPAPGEDPLPGFDSFRQRLHGNLDGGTVTLSNFELRWAGGDNTFDTADDRLVTLAMKSPYQYGSNSIDFNFDETLERGLYRYTAKAGGLRDPFGRAIDGDLDGVAGGDLHRYFGNVLAAHGTITQDLDDDGPGSSDGGGDPGAGGVGVFPDFNNNGEWDTSAFGSTTAPVAIADNDAGHSATLDISVSGFTRPVNYLSVRVLLSHPAPADLILTLRSPSGQTITLLRNRPLPAEVPADSREFEFADEMAESIVATTGLVTYRLRPDEALASFYGSQANGTWRVSVTDTTPGDSGTLISASLTIGDEPLAITNDRGQWIIEELPTGTDTVIRILPPAGWVVRGNIKLDGILISRNHNPDESIEASIVRAGGITGHVKEGAGGLGGFTVYLDGNANGTLDGGETSTVSDANGVFEFLSLPVGSYRVRILDRAGYTVPMAAQSAVLTAADPLSSGHTFAVTALTTPVDGTLENVTPTLRTSPVANLAIDFAEVIGLTLGNLKLTRDGVDVCLANSTLLGSGRSYTLIGLSELTKADGTYTLTVLAPAPASAPTRAPLPTATTWTLDTTPPTASVSPIVGPKGVVDRVSLVFSSPVNGLDASDFELKRDGVALPLGTVQLNAVGSGFELANLGSVATVAGHYTLELKAGAVADAAGNTLAGTQVVQWTVPQRPVKYTAVGAGEGSQPTVIVYDADGRIVRTMTPFDTAYTGGVRVATADVNGDLFDDIIVAPGRGAAPRVKVYDGRYGDLISDFLAFEPNFRGGVLVAAGDVTGDGLAEIIITPDKGGGPRVRVLDALTAHTVADFFGIEDTTFRGGARAALGDVTGDGRLDLIVAAGTGGGPRIAVFDGVSVAAHAPTKPFGDFLAFEASLRNGATIAAADLDGDGKAEIIAGAGDGGGPRLSTFSGADLMNNKYRKVSDFFVGQIDSRGGLRLSVDDVNDDGVQELFVGPGSGVGSRIRVYAAGDLLGSTHRPMREFDPFGGFLGGVYLG